MLKALLWKEKGTKFQGRYESVVSRCHRIFAFSVYPKGPWKSSTLQMLTTNMSKPYGGMQVFDLLFMHSLLLTPKGAAFNIEDAAFPPTEDNLRFVQQAPKGVTPKKEKAMQSNKTKGRAGLKRYNKQGVCKSSICFLCIPHKEKASLFLVEDAKQLFWRITFDIKALHHPKPLGINGYTNSETLLSFVCPFLHYLLGSFGKWSICFASFASPLRVSVMSKRKNRKNGMFLPLSAAFTPSCYTSITFFRAFMGSGRNIARYGYPFRGMQIFDDNQKRLGIQNNITSSIESCYIIRPLLSVSRFEIGKICSFWKLPIYPDTSNQKVKFLRNRIRKQLLPVVKFFFNPQIENILLQFADIVEIENQYMIKMTNELSSELINLENRKLLKNTSFLFSAEKSSNILSINLIKRFLLAKIEFESQTFAHPAFNINMLCYVKALKGFGAQQVSLRGNFDVRSKCFTTHKGYIYPRFLHHAFSSFGGLSSYPEGPWVVQYPTALTSKFPRRGTCWFSSYGGREANLRCQPKPLLASFPPYTPTGPWVVEEDAKQIKDVSPKEGICSDVSLPEVTPVKQEGVSVILPKKVVEVMREGLHSFRALVDISFSPFGETSMLEAGGVQYPTRLRCQSPVGYRKCQLISSAPTESKTVEKKSSFWPFFGSFLPIAFQRRITKFY